MRMLLRLVIVLGVTTLLLMLSVFVSVFRPSEIVPVYPAYHSSTIQDSVHCTLSDMSFCNEATQFRALVATQNLSEIIDNQQSQTVICASRQTNYCIGVPAGTTVTLYEVRQNNTAELMTRNAYVVFFLRFMGQYGPFYFSQITIGHNHAVMIFKNESGMAQYSLDFQKNSATWYLLAASALITGSPLKQ